MIFVLFFCGMFASLVVHVNFRCPFCNTHFYAVDYLGPKSVEEREAEEAVCLSCLKFPHDLSVERLS